MSTALISVTAQYFSDSTSGSGLQTLANTQMAAILSHTIQGVSFNAQDAERNTGNELHITVFYATGGAPISSPYQIVGFVGKTPSDVSGQMTIFMNARTGAFFAPPMIRILSNQRRGLQVFGLLFYNTNKSAGSANWAGAPLVGATGLGKGTNVKSQGAVGDGVTDDLAAIQATVNLMQTAGGGAVYLPGGCTYNISAPIVLPSKVSLIGDGAGYTSDLFPNQVSAASTASTVISATASMNTMVDSRASGAHSNVRMAIQDIFFRCNGNSAYGIYWQSVCMGRIENVMIDSATIFGIYLGCVDSLTSDPTSSQHNTLRNIMLRTYLGSTTGGGILLTGNTTFTGNCSFNVVSNIFVYHQDGVAIDIKNGDGNQLESLRFLTRPNASGYGLIFRESSGPANTDFARDNVVFGIQSASVSGTGGGVKFEGTNANKNSSGNSIFGYSLGNGAPVPVIDTGAICYVVDEFGTEYFPRPTISGTVNSQNAFHRTLFVADTSGGVCTVNGFTLTVNGQVVRILNTGANNLIITNNSGSGSQKIFTTTGADLIIVKGMVRLISDGTSLYEVR